MLLVWIPFGCLLLAGGARAAAEFISSQAYFHHVAAAYWGDSNPERRRRDVQLAVVYDANSRTLRSRSARDHLDQDRLDRALEATRGASDPLVEARIAHRQGDLEAMERQLRRAIRSGQTGSDLGRLLADLYFAKPQVASALTLRALSTDASEPGLAEQVHRWARDAGAWELAEAAARTQLGRSPAPGVTPAVGFRGRGRDWTLRWVQALHRLGRTEEAVEPLERMASRGPGNDDLTQARIAVAAWMNDGPRVQDLARRAYRLRLDASDRHALSRRLLALGHPEVALEFGRPDGDLEARLAFAAGQPERALDRLRSRPPGDPDLERRAAQALLDGGRPADALQWLDDRVAKGPAAETAELRVRALVRLKQLDEARSWLDAVPALLGRRDLLRVWIEDSVPVDLAPATRLALARARDQVTLEVLDGVPRLDFRGQVERAVLGLQARARPAESVLRSLQREQPDDPTLWWGWGRIYALKSNWDRARSALERAVRLDPRSGRAWEALGDAWCGADPVRARQAYQKAVRAFEAAWRSGRLWTRAPAERAKEKTDGC